MNSLTDCYADKWEEINVKCAEYILKEGKEYIKHNFEVNNRITNRSFTILAILIPLFTLTSNFWISKFYENLLVFKILLIINFVLFLYVIVKLSIIIKPFQSMPQGREPKEMTTSGDMLGINYEHDKAYLALLLTEIDNVQNKIDYNDKMVSNRHKSLSQCIKMIGGIFGLFIIITLVYLL